MTDKELQIIRQSSLKWIMQWSQNNNLHLTLKETIGITSVITEYCLYGQTKEVMTKIAKIDNYLAQKTDE